MATWEPVDIDRDGLGEEYDKWDDDIVKNLELRFNKLRKFHGSQSRAFSREHSTQPLPRRQGSDRNKLHGARSLFKFLLLKI